MVIGFAKETVLDISETKLSLWDKFFLINLLVVLSEKLFVLMGPRVNYVLHKSVPFLYSAPIN
jgi:hypothetical protein